ncbi:TerB family tellurite resistance protein [Massilia sp.]|uniref:TerB family tellurite resistance protein n=1 Tax=Massilia sp. TaxID=1882437 RepID=UPI00352E5C14
MRSYPKNSPRAAGRLLALTMIVDGNVALSELKAVYRSRILDHIALDDDEFDAVLHELCNDLLATAHHGNVHVDAATIDAFLDDVDAPELRRNLLGAMWRLADADGWLADAEAIVLNRAAIRWGAESGFVTAH